jgi:hypothetical protein
MMSEREQLIKEIEQAPEALVEEVLSFLLFIKHRQNAINISSQSIKAMKIQLQEMSQDPEILLELNAINEEFMLTEMDGLAKEYDN